jgi:quercetin dioxygenase-like cupin family protein
MLETETYELHGAERVTVREHTPELLEVAVEWDPGDHRPLPHVHAAQDERFVIEDGELTADLDGTRHTLRAGDTLDVPRGTKHRMWNSGTVAVHATWQVRPALRTAEFWSQMHEARKVRPTDAHGMLTPVAAAPLLNRYRTEFRLALPAPVERAALTVLGLAARLKGYR